MYKENVVIQTDSLVCLNFGKQLDEMWTQYKGGRYFGEAVRRGETPQTNDEIAKMGFLHENSPYTTSML